MHGQLTWVPLYFVSRLGGSTGFGYEQKQAVKRIETRIKQIQLQLSQAISGNPDSFNSNSHNPQFSSNFRYRQQSSRPKSPSTVRPSSSDPFQSQDRLADDSGHKFSSRSQPSQRYFSRNVNPLASYSRNSLSESRSDLENFISDPSSRDEKYAESHQLRPHEFPSQSIAESYYSTQRRFHPVNSALKPSQTDSSDLPASHSSNSGKLLSNLQNLGLRSSHSDIPRFLESRSINQDFLSGHEKNPGSGQSRSENAASYARTHQMISRFENSRNRSPPRVDKSPLASSSLSRNIRPSPTTHRRGSSILSDVVKENSQSSPALARGKSLPTFASHLGRPQSSSIISPSRPSRNSPIASSPLNVNAHNPSPSRSANAKTLTIHPNAPPHPPPVHSLQKFPPSNPSKSTSGKTQTPSLKNRWHHVYSDHFDVKNPTKSVVSPKTSRTPSHHLKMDGDYSMNSSVDNFFDAFNIGYHISRIDNHYDVTGKRY